MPAPYSGRCHCGAVTYELRGEPETVYLCHCTDCQKQSASAFGMSMTVWKRDFALLSGSLAGCTIPADSGFAKEVYFCAACGTRLYHSRSNGAQISFKPGTLDDTSWLRPVAHLWTRSKQPWVSIPEDDLAYDGQPTDFEPINKAWRDLI